MYIIEKKTGKQIVFIDGDELNILDDKHYMTTNDNGSPIKEEQDARRNETRSNRR